MVYQIEILDSSRNYAAPIQVPVAIDKEGNFLEYSHKLSQVGKCRFRVATHDPIFTSLGDILKPYKNHVRIRRDRVTVWQGVIVKNPHRNKNFIEVEAFTYLYLLSKILIRHNASVTTGDGLDNYRLFSGSTMAANITTIMNEAIADAGSISAVSSMTLGTIESPNFPANFTTSAGAALTGAWTFGADMTLQFDYRDILYMLQVFGQLSNADFEITDALVFNYKAFIGNRQPNLTFNYGAGGNIEDYDAPMDGDRMANYLVGVAADYGNQILHTFMEDAASQALYGKLAGVAAYVDVKNQNALKAKMTEEMRFISTPNTEIHITLKPNVTPVLGQYGLGDTVRVQISDHIVSVDQIRRIVGIDTKVHTTGKERIRLITNVPRDSQ